MLPKAPVVSSLRLMPDAMSSLGNALTIQMPLAERGARPVPLGCFVDAQLTFLSVMIHASR